MKGTTLLAATDKTIIKELENEKIFYKQNPCKFTYMQTCEHTVEREMDEPSIRYF